PSGFEAARARFDHLTGALEPAQQRALVSLDAQPKVLAQPTSDHVQLTASLNTAQPTAQAANLPAGLSLAASLAQGHDDAQIVVVGDGSLDPSPVPANFRVPIRYPVIGTGN